MIVLDTNGPPRRRVFLRLAAKTWMAWPSHAMTVGVSGLADVIGTVA
jgi:hypothetical protein